MSNWDHEDLKQPHNKRVDEEEIKKAMIPSEEKRQEEIDKVVKMLSSSKRDFSGLKPPAVDKEERWIEVMAEREETIAPFPGASGAGHPKAKADPVNHPSHYTSSPAQCQKCGTPIECIDVVRHMNFNRGNAMKYLWRAGKKDDTIQDLKKSIWYIQDEIKRLESDDKKGSDK